MMKSNLKLDTKTKDQFLHELINTRVDAIMESYSQEDLLNFVYCRLYGELYNELKDTVNL